MKRVVIIFVALLMGACSKQPPIKKTKTIHLIVYVVPKEVLENKDFEPQNFDESEEF